MIEKPLKSFGCSFVLGTELSDWSDRSPNSPSNLTYPALIAKQLDKEYSCRARGAQGNQHILWQILTTVESRKHYSQSLYIINWTYADRFDYGLTITDDDNSWKCFLPTDQSAEAVFYYKKLHSDIFDKWRSLQCIYCAIQTLTNQDIPFLMTCMDPSILDESWVTPNVKLIQNSVRPFLHDFEGTDFLTWSRQHGYSISALNHPLEDAHAAAAEYLMPAIESILRKV